MTWREKKQILFIIIFFFSLTLFINFFLFIVFYRPSQPQPSFSPLKIYPVEYLIYDNSLDLIGKVENPNDKTLRKIRYWFEFYDLENKLIAKTQERESVLTNQETRYLVEINFSKPKETFYKVKLVVDFNPNDFVEKKFEKLPISYYNLNIEEGISKKINFDIFNPSFEKFEDIEALIFLYEEKILVGVLKTNFSLGPQETRKISLTFTAFLNPDYYEIIFQRTNLLK